MSCLYILEIRPLSAISFTGTFSHSMDFFFFFFFASFVVFFAVQKLVSLIRSCLPLFSCLHPARLAVRPPRRGGVWSGP